VKFLLSLVASVIVCHAAESAAALAKSFHDAGLDPDACYRVRDLSFQKDDLRIYLTEGHVIFSRAVEGRRFGALFTTDVPGGDAEVILFPPHRSERLSLSAFTNTPNLNEHLNTGIFLFTDGTGEQLITQLEQLSAKKIPEAGLLLAQSLTPVLKNISASYETRLVQDFISNRSREQGFFYAAVQGRTLGNFDILYDPRAREQIVLGQLAYRNERQFFDTWTSFMSRPYRTGQKVPPADTAIAVKKVEIDAAFAADFHLKATTRLTFTVAAATERAISFDLARRMSVTRALVDGEPAEIFRRDALRVNVTRGENELFLVILPKELTPGVDHTIEFHHEGNVVASAGNNVYYVAARNSWYPSRSTSFARYDLTFRYPKTVDLVASGDLVEDKTEGDTRITRRTTPTPVRFVGFNLGNYEKAEVNRDGFNIAVYANRRLESALQSRLREVPVIPPGVAGPGARQRGRASAPDLINTMPLPPPNPTARLQQLATEISAAMDFLSARLGPPPLKTLTVSPIPAAFGQGFPGLIYLSTLTYLNPDERPAAARSEIQRLFFSELLHAHESAHQWWGNMVTAASYQDEWLMEGLASYMSLMLLEKKKGRKAFDDVLDEYRDHLLSKDDQERTIESAGPIVWGQRLLNSQTPQSWRTITYEKGSWIFHMLRMRLGNAAFDKMLGELVQRYRYKPLTTENFRSVAADFMPRGSDDPKLEAFFEQWVYGTGIPSLKVSHTVTGKAPKVRVRGTVTQSNVPEDFSASVPVELQLPGRKPVMTWVRTSSEPVQFTIDLPRAPSKVVLAPAHAVLMTRN
jgi:hypothetical protein